MTKSPPMVKRGLLTFTRWRWRKLSVRDFDKRLFDIVFSLVAIVLLSPVMIVVAIGVAIFMGRPVLFRQLRPGLHGRLFPMLKFRTMTDARDSHGDLLSPDKRLTPFGKFLRKTSIDEFPQLFNILRAEMSVVGPRPLMVDYLPLYLPEHRRRLDVRPGVTGWAQINGREDILFSRKFALDLWYVDHRSLMLDCWIILRSILKVPFGGGVQVKPVPHLDDLGIWVSIYHQDEVRRTHEREIKYSYEPIEADGLARFFRKTDVTRFLPYPARESVEDMAKRISEKEQIIAVRCDDHMIGVAAVDMYDDSSSETALSVLNIQQDFQGLGIEEIIIEVASRFAAHVDKDVLVCECAENDQEGISFFESMGFRKYQSEQDIVRMCLQVKKIV